MNRNYGPTSHRPYQCFMGLWEGVCKTFSAEGVFIESTLVHMDVYWVNETTWHLHEDFENLYEVGKMVFHTDIEVSGKRCFAENSMIKIEGVELTPYNYTFTIDSAVSKTLVYNNHYFLDPNTRRILTHKVRAGKTHIFQVQDFTRLVQP